jgi:hypothetical protein
MKSKPMQTVLPYTNLTNLRSLCILRASNEMNLQVYIFTRFLKFLDLV